MAELLDPRRLCPSILGAEDKPQSGQIEQVRWVDLLADQAVDLAHQPGIGRRGETMPAPLLGIEALDAREPGAVDRLLQGRGARTEEPLPTLAGRLKLTFHRRDQISRAGGLQIAPELDLNEGRREPAVGADRHIQQVGALIALLPRLGRLAEQFRHIVYRDQKALGQRRPDRMADHGAAALPLHQCNCDHLLCRRARSCQAQRQSAAHRLQRIQQGTAITWARGQARLAQGGVEQPDHFIQVAGGGDQLHEAQVVALRHTVDDVGVVDRRQVGEVAALDPGVEDIEGNGDMGRGLRPVPVTSCPAQPRQAHPAGARHALQQPAILLRHRPGTAPAPLRRRSAVADKKRPVCALDCPAPGNNSNSKQCVSSPSSARKTLLRLFDSRSKASRNRFPNGACRPENTGCWSSDFQAVYLRIRDGVCYRVATLGQDANHIRLVGIADPQPDDLGRSAV